MKEDSSGKFKSLFEYYGFTKEDEKKYPVISRILKKLTPERIKKEIEAIQAIKLPPELQKWVEEYEKVGKRNNFLWKWLYNSFQFVYIPIVPKKFKNSLRKNKVLITVFITVLNDTGDKKEENLFKELAKIPTQNNANFSSISRKEWRMIYIFTKKVWHVILKELKKYPRYREFKDIFYFDITQVVNGIKYSLLVNKNPWLINKTEYWFYISHKMMAVVYSDIDLMASSNIDRKLFPELRKIILDSQKMARIGNWISTWEREIKENDFTSGVFAYAINEGIFTANDLKKERKSEIIKRIKKAKVEKTLLKDWEKYYFKIKKTSKAMQPINIEQFLSSLKKLLIFHLISKGYK